MAVEDFLTRMNALVDELRAHPKVTLLNYHVPTPATEEDFADVEGRIGRNLPEDIKAFYRQCNGIQLRWVHKDNKEVDHKLWSGFMEGPFDYEEICIEQGFEGVVNILGVREVFLRELPFKLRELKDREKKILLSIEEGPIYLSDLSERLWVFDLFDFTYCFSIVGDLAKNDGMAVLLTGQEYRIPSFGTKLIPFSLYLDLLILKKGGASNRIFDIKPLVKDFSSKAFEWMKTNESFPKHSAYDLNYPFHK